MQLMQWAYEHLQAVLTVSGLLLFTAISAYKGWHLE
jgi:hypothetical protein